MLPVPTAMGDFRHLEQIVANASFGSLPPPSALPWSPTLAPLLRRAVHVDAYRSHFSDTRRRLNIAPPARRWQTSIHSPLRPSSSAALFRIEMSAHTFSHESGIDPTWVVPTPGARWSSAQ